MSIIDIAAGAIECGRRAIRSTYGVALNLANGQADDTENQAISELQATGQNVLDGDVSEKSQKEEGRLKAEGGLVPLGKWLHHFNTFGAIEVTEQNYIDKGGEQGTTHPSAPRRFTSIDFSCTPSQLQPTNRPCDSAY